MRAIRDINRLKPNAKIACEMFLAEAKRQGLAVVVTETLRTKERQAELYAQGRTAPGKIVTWTKNSRHQSGLAWDVCKNKKGEEYSDIGFFEALGAIAKSLGITWGGDWEKQDMPHFEVTDSWEEENLEEILKELQEIKNSLKVYHYTADLPDWARPTVQKLLDRGVYKGAGADNLNLTEDIMRTLVILDRAGIFDR